MYDDAIDDFNTSLNLEKNNSSAIYNRGLTYKQLGMNESSLKDFEFIKSHCELNEFPNINIEILNLKKNISGETISIPIHFINQGDKDIQYFEKGKEDFLNLNFKEALYMFDLAISLKPNNFEYLHHRGICKFNLEDFIGAKSDLEKSLSLGNNLSRVMLEKSKEKLFNNRSSFEKGMDFFNVKNWIESITQFSKAIEPFDQGDSSLMFIQNGIIYPIQEVYFSFHYRGYAYYQIAKYEEALADLNWSVGCDSNFQDAHYYRCLTKFKLEDYEGALIDIQNAINLVPGNKTYKLTEGIIYLNLGDKINAKNKLNALAIIGIVKAKELIEKYKL